MPARPFYARRRFFVAVAIAALAYRHRRALAAWLARSTLTTRRALAAAELASQTVAGVARDLSEYLHPPRTEMSSCHSSLPPRSLRRALRVAASPDALIILRNIAGAAARELIAPQVEPHAPSFYRTGSSARDVGQQRIDASPHSVPVLITSLLAALDSAQGKRVASMLIETVVREAVSTFLQQQSKQNRLDSPSSDGGRHWLDILLAAGLSERGRAFAVEVASAVTKAAVPAMVAAQQQTPPELSKASSQLYQSSSLFTPPRRSRPVSTTGVTGRVTCPQTAGYADASSQKSVSSPSRSSSSRHLLQSMLTANNQCTWVDRVAYIAVRERGLVRDIVRAIASQTVRTYLTTRAELKLSPPQSTSLGVVPTRADSGCHSGSCARGNAKDSTSACSSSMAVRTTRCSRDAVTSPCSYSGESRAETNVPSSLSEPTAFESLWQLLVRSVADDIRLSWLRYWNSPPSPNWLFL